MIGQLASGKATSRDVKEEILRRITDGPWGPGTLLPGEVELALPGMSRITPQIRGAIKHVAGVAHVEEF